MGADGQQENSFNPSHIIIIANQPGNHRPKQIASLIRSLYVLEVAILKPNWPWADLLLLCASKRAFNLGSAHDVH